MQFSSDMNLTALLDTQQKNSGQQVNNINLMIAKSLIFVIEHYLLTLAPSFVLTLSCSKTRICKFYDEMLENLFRMWDAPPIQIVNMPKKGSMFVAGPRYSNLILVDSYEAFRAIDVISYSADYNRNEYYYIFLQMGNQSLPTEMMKIFEYCWRHHLINCNIEIQNAKGEIYVYTYYPFSEEGCGNVTVKLINQFNGTSMVNKVLYPKKLTNFYGCALRAAIWNDPPFLYFKESKINDSHILRGMEARVMLTLAEKLNFSIEIKIPPNDERRGLIKGNNLTGALLMLQKRTADFSLGYFRLTYDRVRVATATFSYYQGAQIISFPLSAYSFSSSKILRYPFTGSTWTLIMFVQGIAMAIIFIINKYHKRYPQLFPNYVTRHSYLNMILINVGIPATSMPRRIFARLLCTDWLFFSLILRTAYQALLFHLIRTQLISPVPQSVDELLKYNYTVVMNHDAYLAVIDVEFLSKMNLLVINETEETVAFEYTEKHSRKNLVAVGPLDFLIYYAIENKKIGVFNILPQHIFSLPVTMYLTKHSFLTDQFEKDLMNMCSMGLIDIWARWELNVDSVRKSDSVTNKIFSLSELYMLFVTGFIVLSVATVIFFLELLSLKISFLKNIFTRIQ